MAISSHTLFHYTKSLASLKGILEKGLKLSYCVEKLEVVPMISFCDIPLSQAKFQLDSYGSYVIGFNTDWAVKNGINPVLYIEESSYLSKKFSKSVKLFTNLMKDLREAQDYLKKSTLDDFVEFSDFMFDFNRFSKPYVGTLIQGEETNNNYKFYDEREWRYIPDIESKEVKWSLTHKEYEKFKKEKPKKPHFDFGLEFKAKDIKYLIVKDENDIPKLISFLHDLENLGSAKQIQLLTTRIMTVKQINEDI